MYVGKKVTRVDAYDKVIGRTKYTDDLCDKSAYIARILHSTIANGRVLSIDTSEAEKIPGVVKVFTCFDLTEKHYFPTAGHPWSTDESHQDVADRLVLTDRVRFYGDDIAAVVAEDEVSAAQALRAIKVEYEEYPFVLDVMDAMKEDAPQLHDKYPNNILKHTTISKGNYEEAIKESGLIKVEGWYSTPTVQHCHIENFICYAEMEGDRIKVVSSTQIPHIVRRVIGQALGVEWVRSVLLNRTSVVDSVTSRMFCMNHFVHGCPCSFTGTLLNLMYQERRPLFLLVYVMRSRATSFHGFARMEHLLQENWKHFLIKVLTHLTVTVFVPKELAHSRSFILVIT